MKLLATIGGVEQAEVAATDGVEQAGATGICWSRFDIVVVAKGNVLAGGSTSVGRSWLKCRFIL